MSFYDIYKKFKSTDFKDSFSKTTHEDVLRAIAAPVKTPEDFLTLLSPAAQEPEILEAMAREANALTLRNFGKTITLFTPLYLSNICDNGCIYCGFNRNNPVKRGILSMEEIEKAVDYAHLNGAKVHVTVNTLINNYEIKDVLNYLFKLYQIGVDAVIVQDFGLIWLLKTFIPDLEVHASTQMGLNNYSSIKWANKNNIKRVVLPREVNIKQIKQTTEQLKKDNIDMDIEAFGHGALCYCVSGKCYMSSYNSGRSGNRGACAQPCRREYRLKYRGYNIGNGYLLSTHDLATYNHLQKISDAGVKSLKLEGRMKSGDYIGTIVNSYRNLIDGNEGDYKKDLHLVFNRQFTNGYMMGDKPGEVMGRGHSGHEGLYIGDIVDIDGTKVTIEIKNKEIPVILEPGDGIAFKYNGKIKGIYLEDIVKQDENVIIINTTRLVKVGTEVFISYSKSTHEYLKQFEKETIKNNVPLSLSLTWDENLKMCINKSTVIKFSFLPTKDFTALT